MQTIILKNNQSDHFDLIQYPDGQKSIKLKKELLNIKDSIEIKCRIINFSELEILGCLISALEVNDFYITKLNFVYLFGIRCDRTFEVGNPNYFKDVVAPIIDGYDIKGVEILWPFCPLVIKFDYIFGDSYKLYTDLPDFEKYFLIAGDETAKYCHYSDINYFDKKRDSQGNFSISLNTDNFPKVMDKPILIMDDLCDGGATFIEEAKILKELYPDNKLYLYIYHGLFTKGIDHLLEYFDKIYCTNSYQDIDHPQIIQHKVI